MTFDEIVLENFGPYRGRNSITLTPPSASKPVILFGALNGGGKTTLLDAFQLVFHGKLARCSSRNGLGYHDFLQGCIHRGAGAATEAGLELSFRTNYEGQEHSYRIRRSWGHSKASVNEKLQILRDGEIDAVLTGAWADHAEDLIPSAICPLFFFDGEKIEEFANLEHSGQILSTAINSLLGLDIVQRLITDLSVVERRSTGAIKDLSPSDAFKQMRDELRSLQEEKDNLLQQQAELQNRLDRHQRELTHADAQYSAEGGGLYEQRHALEEERETCARYLEQAENRLRCLAEGPAPLLIVKDLLTRCFEQARAEEEAEREEVVRAALEKRDQQLVALIKEHTRSEKLLEVLNEFLRKDQLTRKRKTKVATYLSLNSTTRDQVALLLSAELPRISQEMATVLDETDRLRQQLADLDRNIAGIPQEEAIAAILAKREVARKSVAEVQSEIDSVASEVHRVGTLLDLRKRGLAKLVETQGRAALTTRDTKRIILHAKKGRGTLRLFRERVVQQHLMRLEGLILDGYRTLLHKRSLVSRVVINPETFAVSLYDARERLVPTDRLSAGERQILAVAMLWGLARASGRPLPTIIDTPLGRLDSTHRANLVERYFPCASHQILLLSTDEEVDEIHFRKIQNRIGRTYTLEYQEGTEATTVRDGYFWD